MRSRASSNTTDRPAAARRSAAARPATPAPMTTTSTGLAFGHLLLEVLDRRAHARARGVQGLFGGLLGRDQRVTGNFEAGLGLLLDYFEAFLGLGFDRGGELPGPAGLFRPGGACRLLPSRGSRFGGDAAGSLSGGACRAFPGDLLLCALDGACHPDPRSTSRF